MDEKEFKFRSLVKLLTHGLIWPISALDLISGDGRRSDKSGPRRASYLKRNFSTG